MGKAAVTGMSAVRPRRTHVVTCTDTRAALRVAQPQSQQMAQPIGATLVATSCSWSTEASGHAAWTVPRARANCRSSERAAGAEGTVPQQGCHHSRPDRSRRRRRRRWSKHPIQQSYGPPETAACVSFGQYSISTPGPITTPLGHRAPPKLQRLFGAFGGFAIAGEPRCSEHLAPPGMTKHSVGKLRSAPYRSEAYGDRRSVDRSAAPGIGQQEGARDPTTPPKKLLESFPVHGVAAYPGERHRLERRRLDVNHFDRLLHVHGQLTALDCVRWRMAVFAGKATDFNDNGQP